MSQLACKNIYFLILSITLIFTVTTLEGQESGSILIKMYSPGSADLNDSSLDKKMLAFVDSLMKRNDIEVRFLGCSDTLRWKKVKDEKEISTALDQAKKLERASRLRKKYGKGEIGTSDEPVRGVKVVWSLKKPDIFKMNNRLERLEILNDSLRYSLLNLNTKKNQDIQVLEDSLKIQELKNNKATVVESYFGWEAKSGLFLWSAGNPYDLSVPYVGIALKRELWAFELLGGLTPWSRKFADGNRSDAFLMGTINLFPEYWYKFKLGMFSGWEFFTNSDNWTMKIMGVTAGPDFHSKYFDTFIGYNLGKLSTLSESNIWVHGGIVSMSFNFKLNKWTK